MTPQPLPLFHGLDAGETCPLPRPLVDWWLSTFSRGREVECGLSVDWPNAESWPFAMREVPVSTAVHLEVFAHSKPARAAAAWTVRVNYTAGFVRVCGGEGQPINSPNLAHTLQLAVRELLDDARTPGIPGRQAYLAANLIHFHLSGGKLLSQPRQDAPKPPDATSKRGRKGTRSKT